MFGFRLFLFGLLVGACGGLFAANYHVVNTAQGVVVVPRTQRPPLRSSYVDIRHWSQAMWTNHPEVTQALIADGRSALIRDQAPDAALQELIPEQTQSSQPAPSRNVAIRSPNQNRIVANKPAAAGDTTRLLDAQSPTRQKLGAAFDQAISPIVDDDPADLAHDPANEVLPTDTSHDEMISRLEERLGGLADSASTVLPSTNSPAVEAIPTSGQTNEMARDLLQRVIPPGSPLPRSAAPFRDLGRSLLSAPAPGQGARTPVQPRVPAQSQLLEIKPF